MAPPIDGHTDLAPREARYDESRLVLLDEYFARGIDAGELQGASYLMARQGKVFAHRALGRLTPAQDSPPLRPDSIEDRASSPRSPAAGAAHANGR